MKDKGVKNTGTSPQEVLVTLSGTRWRIMELVAHRPRTVCGLARNLGISKSAVHKHVTRLSRAGFIRRREDERKWVYYSVAPEGRRCLSALGNLAAGLPERTGDEACVEEVRL